MNHVACDLPTKISTNLDDLYQLYSKHTCVILSEEKDVHRFKHHDLSIRSMVNDMYVFNKIY